METDIPLVNPGLQFAGLREELLEVFERISSSGHYVLSPELETFEAAFADYCGTKYAVGVGNGSDALILSLWCLGLGEGDEVITAPNSFIASAWAIARTGATLRFCDVGDDMNMDPAALEAAITPRTKAIMPVHLTGRVANMEAIQEIADKHRLLVVEDAAQAVGASRHGKRAGSFGATGCFSLHPLKNLHVHGDGGMITTNDEALVTKLKQYRNHGLKDRDTCLFWGINSRLDALQAGIANVKMKYIEGWNERYRSIAQRYSEALHTVVKVPVDQSGELPVYHRYMIRLHERDALQTHLRQRGIGTAVNYPVPLHLQPAAADLGYARGDFPVAERCADTILSLPCFPELTNAQVDRVADAVRSFFS